MKWLCREHTSGWKDTFLEVKLATVMVLLVYKLSLSYESTEKVEKRKAT